LVPFHASENLPLQPLSNGETMFHNSLVHQSGRIIDSYAAISYAGEEDAKKWSAGDIALTLATLGAVAVGVSMLGGFLAGSPRGASEKDVLAQL
jgi:hypothetical protein